jgi:16S rRNA (cytidine1402-2'-O)-methyltransferase
MKKAIGTMYLLPLPLGIGGAESLSIAGIQKLSELDYFIAERARTFRRFLKEIAPETNFEGIEVHEWTKGMVEEAMEALLHPLEVGRDVGIVSEAGCPGIADPGALAVQLAHQFGYKVVPVAGPSSVLLALMGSGFNGQNFRFNGYLPREKNNLQNKLVQLERSVRQSGCTEIFIETPYRNDQLLDAAIQCLHQDTHLAIAADLTLPSQMIRRDSIGNWKSEERPKLHKRPAVFLIGS